MADNILVSCIRELSEYRKLIGAVKNTQLSKKLPIMLSGLCDGAAEILCEALFYDLPNLRPVLLLCSDDRECMRLSRIFSDFGTENICFPARDLNFHNLVSSHEFERARISALMKIRDGFRGVILTTPDALLGFCMPPEVLKESVFTVKGTDNISPEEIEAKLVHAGYIRSELAEGPGQFARRGGIVDIVTDISPILTAAPDSDDARGILAVRIEFFGDEIDRIGRYDSATQRVTDNIKEVIIPPARENICKKETLEEIRDSVKQLLKKAEDAKVRLALESELSSVSTAIECGTDISFSDKYLSLIYPQKSTLMDYLCDCGLVIIKGNSAVRDRMKAWLWQLEEDTKNLVESRLISGKYALYSASAEDFSSFCAKRTTMLTDLFGQGMTDRELGGLFGFSTKHSLSAAAGDDMLLEDIQTLCDSSYRIVLMAENAEQARSYEEKLLDKEVVAKATETAYAEDVPLSILRPGTVLIIPSSPVEPFELVTPRIAILSLSGIHRAEKKAQKADGVKKSARKRILSFNDLHVGDYVVHETHGIGRYDGITTLTVDGVTRDYITIQYAGSDKLFMPADSLDKVSKYIGSKNDEGAVRLSKFGGAEWGRTKARAKSALRDIAKELIKLYAERTRRPGFAFIPDDNDQRLFEDSFEYRLTDAQDEAIKEIKADMMRATPMDRLLCGDVGYGKTEVAFRAAYKAVLSDRKVAILVPTTILALQHYETAKMRFRETAVNVAMLSRFVKPKEQKDIMAKMKRGDVDILIGTHRLLSKEIDYKDLGLLIVDEEQRFGVAQKEKIKQIAGNIDVLSLSATPIPRTLNMAMSGIRDISVLDEAPGTRLPVQTYVLEHNDVIIAEAIKKELRRGGQVFYLYNFVDTIDMVAGKLRQMIPEANIVTAHGKMDKERLEDIWRDMTEGKIDVLVSTTIIEAGVDVPNANTLIVQNAHRLGLSQLHQLRGRVGRSPRRAYAYFTFPPDKSLTEISQKRLEAIKEYAEFGAGFQIAMRDLELRGAGNVLGAEQSGHLDEVGYDMYIKLLNEAILEEKGEKQDEKAECKISLSLSAFIPDSYVPSAPQRMAMYKRLAHIASKEDATDITDELIDRFGEPPEAVNNLIDIALLRATATELGLADITQDGFSLRIKQTKFDVFAWQDLQPFIPGRMKILVNPTPMVVITLGKGDSVIAVLEKILEKLRAIQSEN